MLDLAAVVVLAAVLVGILTRLGVLPCIVLMLFSTWEHVSLTTDVNSWDFASSAITLALFTAVAIYGFVVSLGGRIRIIDPALDS